MAKTTYLAVAPDGSQHTRTTDRDYTHAVLVEGPGGWGVLGFCGRLDLAQKKQAERTGAIIVEAIPANSRALGASAPDADEPEVAEKTEPADEPADGASEAEPTEPTEPKRTIGRLVEELLMDETLDYAAIVERVVEVVPEIRTGG
ncbi:hypothetical protein [Albimonas pacifica]|uniref:Uncharacterized protein n=1 Tax=Albimonas pacifica TaxID=1114924 RepID=A0A1I3QHC6_9RHOB|nr:hypothetical protein [Albimonas pacifica]SFJ33438.1 hypothetical protein SAMN05216258_1421 [Albimonas pacifica]